MPTGKIALECAACGFVADFDLARICDRHGFMQRPRCPACDGIMWTYKPEPEKPLPPIAVSATDEQYRDWSHDSGEDEFDREEYPWLR